MRLPDNFIDLKTSHFVTEMSQNQKANSRPLFLSLEKRLQTAIKTYASIQKEPETMSQKRDFFA